MSRIFGCLYLHSCFVLLAQSRSEHREAEPSCEDRLGSRLDEPDGPVVPASVHLVEMLEKQLFC